MHEKDQLIYLVLLSSLIEAPSEKPGDADLMFGRPESTTEKFDDSQ
jgi:hypothetical protein